MKIPLPLLAIILCLFAAIPLSHGALPPPSIELDGTIAAIDAKSLAVQNPKGTKVFVIYPGTENFRLQGR